MKVSAWLERIGTETITERLWPIFGEEQAVEYHQNWYATLLRHFAQIVGPDREVLIARAPARINLLGMHIDHRGGSVNPIACKEIIMIVERREDDHVLLYNTDEAAFPPVRFTIHEELPEDTIDDWEAWTAERARHMQKAGLAGHWANYVKAPILYLQNELRKSNSQRLLGGMNAVVSGNIPRAAGLSSSSALVVCAAEAILALNGLEKAPERLVTMCGLAEWYVGTRGGMGDHAAIKCSRQGSLAHISFFPLRVETIPFPADYRVVVCNTLVEAQKAAGARDLFNRKVATYEIALLLIKQNYPGLASRIHYLRDVNAAHLGLEESAIYEILLTLPATTSRQELAAMLPEHCKDLERLYRTHANPPEGYRVRHVCLFGLAECERSEAAVQSLRRGDAAGFGELMNISHEGDRVTRLEAGRRVSYDPELSDGCLQTLIADLRSSDPERAKGAHIYRQPGGYRVSCPEGDELVDLARQVEGVVGARLVGAGLGGCVAVLTRQESVSTLVRTLRDRFYHPRGLPLATEVCIPVEGSGVLRV